MLRIHCGRVEHQLVDLVVVLRGVPAHDGGAPRPAQQVDLRNAAALEDEIHRRADVLDRGFGAHDRLVVRGRLVHLGRARGLAVAAHVHQVDVVAVLRDVVHPGQAVQLQVERGLGGVGRAMHVQQDLLARKLLYPLRMLVAHVEADARVHRRHHEFFHHDLAVFVFVSKKAKRGGAPRKFFFFFFFSFLVFFSPPCFRAAAANRRRFDGTRLTGSDPVLDLCNRAQELEERRRLCGSKRSTGFETA